MNVYSGLTLLIALIMEHRFTYSLLIKVLSGICILCFAILLYCSLPLDDAPLSIAMGAIALLLLHPIMAMPLRLRQDEAGIHIHRLLWTSHYRSEDYEISVLEGEDMLQGIRLLGSGGYFGFTGIHWSRSRGLYRLLQTSDSKRYLCLTPRPRSRKKYPIFIAI